MFRAKRKVEELGEQVVSAAVGDVFARSMSAAVGRYAAHAEAAEQVERLGTLVIMVHSAVEAAEGVHIRSWWLRRWLWRLRDAALDGDEVLRSSLTRQHQQKADEESGAGGGGRRLWNAARRVFLSVKSLLLASGDDGTARVSAAVARLESLSTGLAEFLKLLDMEITKSRPPPPPPPLAAPPPQRIPSSAEAEGSDYRWRKAGSITLTGQQYEDAWDPQLLPIEEEILHVCGSIDGESSEPKPKRSANASSEPEEHDLAYSSYMERIRRAANRLTTRTPAPPPAASSDDQWATMSHRARLCIVLAYIQRALRTSDRPEVHGKRWLAEWRQELQGLADRADLVRFIHNVPVMTR
ncbi:unnamed protein product [Urochloa humidicola]